MHKIAYRYPFEVVSSTGSRHMGAPAREIAHNGSIIRGLSASSADPGPTPRGGGRFVVPIGGLETLW